MTLELPLLKRELIIGILRTKRALVLIVLAAILSSVVTLCAWPDPRMFGAAGMENIVAVTLFFETQLTAAILIIPAFTAGAISGERERGTYELLYSTLLSPASIVFSKVLSSIGFVLLLLAATAPMVCALHLVGGVSFSTILECYAVTLGSVVLSGLICLHASMRSERTSRAVVRGMGWVIFWNGGLLFVIGLFLMLAQAEPDESLSLLFAMSPHMVIPASVFGSTPFAIDLWVYAVGYSTLLSAIYLRSLLRLVRNPEIRLSPRAESRALAGNVRRPKRRSFLTLFLLDMAGESMPVLGNPIFQKEIRTEFFGRAWHRNLIFWGSLGLFVLILLAISQPRSRANWMESMQVVCSVSMALLALVTPAIAASAFPREIENGNLDFLRSTLLSLRTVLRGKLFAAIYAVSGIVIATALSCLPAIGHIFFRYCLALLVVATMLGTVAAISLMASALSRKTVAALVGAYGVVLTWLILWPLLGAFLDFDRDAFIASSPFGALMAVLRPSFPDSHLASFLAFFAAHAGASAILIIWAGHYLETARSRD